MALSDDVMEDEQTLALMDIDPSANGHLLVFPKRHNDDPLSDPADDLLATMVAAQRIAKAMCTLNEVVVRALGEKGSITREVPAASTAGTSAERGPGVTSARWR